MNIHKILNAGNVWRFDMTAGMKQKTITFKSLMYMFIAVCLTFSLPAPVPVYAGEIKTVRVGYYENAIFEEGAQDGAVKTGYAYEYYRNLPD